MQNLDLISFLILDYFIRIFNILNQLIIRNIIIF